MPPGSRRDRDSAAPPRSHLACRKSSGKQESGLDWRALVRAARTKLCAVPPPTDRHFAATVSWFFPAHPDGAQRRQFIWIGDSYSLNEVASNARGQRSQSGIPVIGYGLERKEGVELCAIDDGRGGQHHRQSDLFPGQQGMNVEIVPQFCALGDNC